MKQALLAVTVLALSCSECVGGVEATHSKLIRPANQAAPVGMAHRKRTSVDDGMTLRGAGKSSARPRFTVSQSQAARLVTHARRKKPERVASNVKSSTSQIPTLGLASFYSQDQETASGESFDRRRLNAAHPSLPFGTRLRVTNVMNGKSVTVRINDRGPFVRGRIIDVTAAAAEALGMVNAGVAKVTLNIIR